MKAFYSARELADLKLPGLPVTRENAARLIGRIAASSPDLARKRDGRGGGYEIAFDALPEPTRAELRRRQRAAVETSAIVSTPAAPVPAARQNAAPEPAHLTHRQRKVMAARLAVCQEIDRIAIAGGHGVSAAVSILVADFAAGILSEPLMQACRDANDRARGLSTRTIYRWIKARKDGETAPRKTRAKHDAPAWLDSFLVAWRKPQKPDLAAVYRDWIETLPAVQRPSYAAVRRALAKMSHIERHMGREGKLALRARQAYTVRDFASLAPTTIYTADGTTFDAEVTHPIHGRPFKPEITVIVDVATRRAVGWSAGLAESQLTVADALARACDQGIPAIFYTDRGPGYRNAAMHDEVAGLLRRLGVTPMLALPRNAQAKGVVENFQKRWITVARQFPTFTGAGMDREAKQLAYKTTRREIALVGASRVLPSWTDFVAAIEAALVKHNDRPHRALPWTRDEATRAKRHLTPNELWRQKVAAGAELIVPDEAERLDLFRPYEVRRVRRCMVTLGTNSYFASELDAFHEQDVMVGYDVRDARQVWIRRIDMHEGERRPGALVCVAQFEGNKTRYVPISFEQAAMEKRAEGRRRRLADKLDRVEAELRPAALLTLQPVQPDPEFLSVEASATRPQDGETAAGSDVAQVSRLDIVDPAVSLSPAAEGGRPFFHDDIEFAQWVAAHPAEATATDRELIVELLTSEASKFLLRRAGVDLGRLRAAAIEEAA
ncbi:MAG: Mu transposase C-terminal domain-containing protein [Rhodoblastus sp.]